MFYLTAAAPGEGVPTCNIAGPDDGVPECNTASTAYLTCIYHESDTLMLYFGAATAAAGTTTATCEATTAVCDV